MQQIKQFNKFKKYYKLTDKENKYLFKNNCEKQHKFQNHFYPKKIINFNNHNSLIKLRKYK